MEVTEIRFDNDNDNDNDNETIESMIDRADKGLYQAKVSGRNFLVNN